ncbi:MULTISPECIES: hypothetical protein [unclassified Streptomyces]|uniref:hypothetical protein n=1 Tax=unclassified Streptomyces TaxID=2593676 RepID=UPI0033B093AA
MGRKSYRAMYGTRECWATPSIEPSWPSAGDTYRYFLVSLTKDPGYGPMTFPNIGREQLAFLGEEPPPPIVPYHLPEEG